MAFTPTQFFDLRPDGLAGGFAGGFDTIIDARSPDEYAEDHIPGAISLPVLSNEERARVGTLYKQVSPFDARKLGAALVAANVAQHLQGELAAMQGGWRPLVYCWRGGKRSGSFALILGQIGWRAETLAGGYKAWRTMVADSLYMQPFPAPVVVLGGNTGTGKTALLPHVAARGVQVLDLEGLANHRGSLFGAVGPQPSQKAFETALAYKIAALDPTRPVVVESESSKIGNCRLPASIWKAMVAAPRILIEAPVAARAAHLVAAYPDMTQDTARLMDVIEKLRHAHSGEQIAAWQAMVGAGQFQALAEGLMMSHYDPRYGKHRERSPHGEVVQTQSLAAADLPRLAGEIVSKIAAMF
jgi:tRNA 2-selenouridine synthase